MSQSDVLECMKEYRKAREDWLTIDEIKGMMLKRGATAGAIKGLLPDLRRLCTFNEIEIKLIMIDRFRTMMVYRAIK